MKEKLSITEVKPEEDMNLFKISQEDEDFKDYLIRKNEFILFIDEILSSKEKKIVTSSKQLAKSYNYLCEIMKNLNQQSFDFHKFKVKDVP